MTEPPDDTQYSLKPSYVSSSSSEDIVRTPSDDEFSAVQWQATLAGRFEPLSLLGRGGFATVYRVFDRKLQREVALKILHPSTFHTRDSQQLLKREALATASLHHPNIVALHDFDSDKETYFLVCELIRGPTLAQYIQDHPQGCDLRASIEIILCVAEALSHAHSMNVLHRDIKPSNILLDGVRPTGSLPFTPRLADFGLASVPTVESLSLSASGLMGTIHYLSPETINEQKAGYSAQSDIYALGAVFGELLTGQKVIDGTTYSQIIQDISQSKIASLRAKRKDIPKDVLAVFTQAMAPLPHRRYASAEKFALDLRNCMHGKPVSARIPNMSERSWRAARRHPAISVACLLSLLSATLVSALIFVNSLRLAKLNSELEGKNESLQFALNQSELARYHNEQIIYALDMAEATQEFHKGDLRSTRSQLARYAHSEPLSRHRDIEWNLLMQKTQPREMTAMWTAPGALYVGCYSPDGRWLLVGGEGDQITILDVDAKLVHRQWDTGQREINSLRVDPNGSVLWSTGDNGTVCAWNLSDSRLLWSTQVFEAEAHDLIHLTELNRLVVLGSKDEIQILCGESGQLIEHPDLPLVGYRSIAELKDGKRFLAGHAKDHLHLLDGQRGEVIQSLDLLDGDRERAAVRCLTISPDNDWVAAATVSNRLHLVRFPAMERTETLFLENSPRILMFGDGGHRETVEQQPSLLVCMRSGVFHEYRPEVSGNLLLSDQWANDGQRVFGLVKHPDRREFCALTSDGRVLQWQEAETSRTLPEDTELASVQSHLFIDASRLWNASASETLGGGIVNSVHSAAQSPRPLLLVSYQRGTKCIRLDAPNVKVTLAPETQNATLCSAGPAGLWVIEEPNLARSISWTELSHALDRQSSEGELKLEWQHHPLPMRADEFTDFSRTHRLVASSDGKWFAGFDDPAKSVWLMNASVPNQPLSFPVPEMSSMTFEPGTHRCWWLSGRNVYHYDFDGSSEPQLLVALPDLHPRSLAFSSDGTSVAIATSERVCYLWDKSRSQLLQEFTAGADIKTVSFSPCGRTLLVVSHDGSLECWNLASGRKTYWESYFSEPRRDVFTAGFSGDANILLRSRNDQAKWDPLQLSSPNAY